MLSKIWVIMITAAFGFGAINGTLEEVGLAAIEGAKEALSLCMAIGGPICLWAGVTALLQKSGVLARFSRLLRPILRRLFPSAAEDPAISEAISTNLAANLLGLGNAATPAGLRAAKLLAAQLQNGVATDALCMLVVLNTASLQIIPSTLIAVRAANGAARPFDFLPAVWLASAAALAVGLSCAWLGRAWGKKMRRDRRWK